LGDNNKMRRARRSGITHWFAIATVLVFSCLLVAEARSKPRPPQQSSSTTSGSTGSSAPAAAKKKTTKKRRAKREPSQKAPTPQRISEIQSALARKGYYQGEPTGKWDANTIAAMQKFQAANGMDASGKINASSLQKLGLGSNTAGVSAPKPASSAPASTTPAPAAASPAPAPPPASAASTATSSVPSATPQPVPSTPKAPQP
jgi:peptidoglycan hydrolase-like protein with peptidoglycan-binding domain